MVGSPAKLITWGASSSPAEKDRTEGWKWFLRRAASHNAGVSVTANAGSHLDASKLPRWCDDTPSSPSSSLFSPTSFPFGLEVTASS